MDKDFSYSLWVKPREGDDLHFKLKKLIGELSQRFSTPVFEPHVTLLPGVDISEQEVISKTQELARKIPPYKITLELVDFTGFFFQSLVIRAAVTRQVLDANKQAREIFGKDEDTLYVPHLSVMYVQNLDNKTKQQLAEEIEGQFKGLEFMAEDISIWKTSPDDISGWKMISKFNLNG